MGGKKKLKKKCCGKYKKKGKHCGACPITGDASACKADKDYCRGCDVKKSKKKKKGKTGQGKAKSASP